MSDAYRDFGIEVDTLDVDHFERWRAKLEYENLTGDRTDQRRDDGGPLGDDDLEGASDQVDDEDAPPDNLWEGWESERYER